MFGWVSASRLRESLERESRNVKTIFDQADEIDHLKIRLENRDRFNRDLTMDLNAAEAVGVEQQGEIESLTNALAIRGRSIDWLVNTHREAEALLVAQFNEAAAQSYFWQQAWLAGLQGEQKVVEQ